MHVILILPRLARVAAAASLLPLTLLFPPLSAGFATRAHAGEQAPLVVAADDSSDQPAPGLMDSVQDWLARANRAFQGTVVRRLSTPSSGDDAIAQKLKDVSDQDRAARDAKAAKDAEEKRQRLAEDAKRKADDEARRKAEEEAKAKEEADAKALAEDAKRNADEAIRAAQKVAEERQAAEAKKKADEDAKRQAEEDQAREAARKADEERRLAEEEQNRQRSITLTPEPIPSREQTRKLASADDVASSSRHYERHLWHGPAVKRWIWRERRQCLYAGRRRHGRYTVRAGDTLWLIAKRYYHSGWRYRHILNANPWLHRHPNLIRPCQRLYLPRWRSRR